MNYKLYSSLFLLALAAISNSICDILWFRFDTSIFAGLNPQWWNPAISWANEHWLITLKDAWHFFKTLWVGFAILSVITYGWHMENRQSKWWNYLLHFVLYSLVWNLTFNLFYTYIWR